MRGSAGTRVTTTADGEMLTVVRRSADGSRAVVVDVGDGVVRVRMLRLVRCGSRAQRWEAQSDATLESACTEPLDPDDAPAALGVACVRLLARAA